MTFVIGVGSALLGSIVARALGVGNRAPASLSGQSWIHWHWLASIRWDWIVLAIQLGFAVIATAIAAAISHTRVAYQEPLNRVTLNRRGRPPRTLPDQRLLWDKERPVSAKAARRGRPAL